MFGFKVFTSAVYNHETKTAKVKKILTFLSIILNIKYHSEKYEFIHFYGKGSFRDANHAVKLFNAKKNDLTINDLTDSERQIKHVDFFICKTNNIVSEAIKKAQSSKLEIPLKL